MPSYKIHSIKNNKKLSFIIDGESEEIVKQSLSLDGFIVITMDKLDEELEENNYFIFNALKDNRNRIEGKVAAPDIFQAYKILKDDYQYTILKLYPMSLTDKKEQDFIFQNVVSVFSGYAHQTPSQEESSKAKANTITTGEITTLKKYFEIISPLVVQSELTNKELILYDMKKIMMTNSVSGMEGMLKKTIKLLYEKSNTTTKRKIYKTLLPIIKRTGVFVLPPWYFIIADSIQKTSDIFKILFLPPDASKKLQKQKDKIKKLTAIQAEKNKITEEKHIYSNKNIQILLQKKYRTSWLDIFKIEGGYSYFYSLMRQVKIMFWLKIIQEYIGMTCIYTCFFLSLGFLGAGTLWSTTFLFFNQYLISFLGLIIVSLVFSVKEI